METKSKSKEDVLLRLSELKSVSLLNSSEEYLLALLREVFDFKDKIEEALTSLSEKEERKKSRKSA